MHGEVTNRPVLGRKRHNRPEHPIRMSGEGNLFRSMAGEVVARDLHVLFDGAWPDRQGHAGKHAGTSRNAQPDHAVRVRIVKERFGRPL